MSDARCPLSDQGNEHKGCFKDTRIIELEDLLRYIAYHRDAMGRKLVEHLPRRWEEKIEAILTMPTESDQ